jgi:hypothetical protein
MVFNTGGTATSGEAMRIDNATGIVGIRTSSIAGVADSTGVQALQLGGTHLIHYDEDAAGTSSFSNNVYWNGSQNTTVFSGKASQIYMQSGNIIFRNSDDNHGVGAQVANFHERLRINSEGKVGINSPDPNFLVHINKGTSSYAPARTTETVLGVNSSYDAAGTLGFNITQMDGNWLDGTSGGDTAFGPIWTHQDNVRAGILYDVRNTEKFQLFSSYGPIEFMTNATSSGNAVPTDSSMTTKMKIALNGNVGIGIDPQVLLHVQAGTTGNGTVRIGGGAGLQLSHNNSGATVQTIESLYRTTNASANLQIKTGHLTIFTGTSGAQAMDISETGNVDIAGVLTNDAKRIIDHPTQSHALAHYQELVCHNSITTSNKNTWMDVAFTGHSCVFKVYGATLENGNNALGGARLITNMLVTYGSDTFTTDAYKVTPMNGGGVSSLEYRYLNSGGNAGSHRLQVKVNWSTSNTVAVYTTITGMSETLSVAEDN